MPPKRRFITCEICGNRVGWEIDEKSLFTANFPLVEGRYCLYCGPRKYFHRKRAFRRRYVTYRRKVQKKKKLPTRRSAQAQRVVDAGVGSLSPLCIRCNLPPQQKNKERYKKITPEILYECLALLTLWRENVPFKLILHHIKENHPVTPNLSELRNELQRKLFIAHKSGMVAVDSQGRWRLTTSLERLRQVPQSVVTRFWELYCDTMNPFTLKRRTPRTHVKKKDSDSDDSLPSDDE